MRFINSFAGGVVLLAIAGGCASTAETGYSGTKKATMPKPKAAVAAPAAKLAPVGSRFDKPGFKTLVKDGRLWVFAEGSEELSAYKASGKTPAVHVTRIKAGPEGMTIISPERETLVGYMVAKPGFQTVIKDGRLWVFAEGSESLAAYRASGKTPAVHVTRVKAGPEGMTIISPERETLVGYMVAKPGFQTVIKDGRLWVFAEGTEELAAYKASGKTPAVHVTRVKAGPEGMTIISPEGETLVDYMVSKPGFHTVVKDGRLWVFADGSAELAAYKASGKTPAVHATRIKAGPLGMTIIAPELSVLDAYMK